MKKCIAIVLLGLLVACSNETKDNKEGDSTKLSSGAARATNSGVLTYPVTKKGDKVDIYFGTQVADPYRWLEDDLSEETGDWVKAQNDVTFDYLAQIPYRNQLKERLETLWNYERVSAPFKEGKYTYFYKNNGLQNQSVVYRKGLDGEPEVFLDPNRFSEDGTASLAQLSF